MAPRPPVDRAARFVELAGSQGTDGCFVAGEAFSFGVLPAVMRQGEDVAAHVLASLAPAGS